MGRALYRAIPDRTRLLLRLWIALALAPVLSGCLLMSGTQQSSDRAEDAGNVTVQFVSAEGTEVRQVQAANAASRLAVTVFARAEHGQLRIEILDPQSSAALVVEGTPDERVGRATVATDTQGMLHYRIRATGAQHGGFQILYQPAGS